MDLALLTPEGLSETETQDQVVRRRQSIDSCGLQEGGPGVWGRANSRTNSKSSIIQVGSDNVVLVEVGSREEEPGPFITRVPSRRSSVAPAGQGSLPSPDKRPPQTPYKAILATADSKITQAETILSSLGHPTPRLGSLSDSEEDPASLGEWSGVIWSSYDFSPYRIRH